jgi:hypothetical protein
MCKYLCKYSVLGWYAAGKIFAYRQRKLHDMRMTISLSQEGAPKVQNISFVFRHGKVQDFKRTAKAMNTRHESNAPSPFIGKITIGGITNRI